MAGSIAVYAVTTPFGAGPEVQIHQGEQLVAAAAVSGVPWLLLPPSPAPIGPPGSREAALPAVPPNRDLSEPLDRGLITLERPPVELGELVNGTHRGRSSSGQLTVYKGVGVALEDATAAGLVMAAARKGGKGTEIHL